MSSIQEIIDGLEDLKTKLVDVEDIEEASRSEVESAIDAAIDAAENATITSDEDDIGEDETCPIGDDD